VAGEVLALAVRANIKLAKNIVIVFVKLIGGILSSRMEKELFRVQ
jgi:hypothetical protein